MVTKNSAKAKPGAVSARLQGLPPVICDTTVLLVLGSFPGVASLAAQQYYGHPQNHFWRIQAALFAGEPVPVDYETRMQWLLIRGVGLWDVYGSCKREGSLDTSIRHAQVNDFAGLARRFPGLRAIAHNGGESWRHARHSESVGLPVFKLPSTSPANASWSFERKLAAWREVYLSCGLVAG